MHFVSTLSSNASHPPKRCQCLVLSEARSAYVELPHQQALPMAKQQSIARMPWIVVCYLFLVVLESYCMEVASSARLPDMYWNASNPIFRIDNTDHIIDVNRGNNQFEYDQINLICPTYPKGTRAEDTESYIIYNVSKEEYDSCSITNNNARIIAVCDKPHQLMYFTITFRSFTPQPGGLEFKPGQDYYFISTSTGHPRGVNQKFGGRCATHNMKVVFKVSSGDDPLPSAPGKAATTSTSTANSNNNASNAMRGASESEANDKSNKSITANSKLAESGSPAVANAPSTRPGYKPSIIITTIKPPSSVLNNTISDSSAASAPRSPSTAHNEYPIYGANSGNNNMASPNKPALVAGSLPAQRPYPKRPITHVNQHLNPLWNNGGNGHEQPLSGSTGRPPVTPSTPTTTSTPYWWRPHFTKVPLSKQNFDVTGGDSNSNWPPPSSSGADGGATRKTGAWVLVVGSGVAVGVACLIVCGLFACTNYLFFPPRRKDNRNPQK